jgi:hypothetical protein
LAGKGPEDVVETEGYAVRYHKIGFRERTNERDVEERKVKEAQILI